MQRRKIALARTADFGIDLGSVNTVVATKNGDVVFNEPTCIARPATGGEPVAFGYEAALMAGKSADAIDVVYPFSRGRLGDADALYAFLAKTFATIGSGKMRLANASIPVSTLVSLEDRNMVTRIARELGLAEVYFVSDVMAAAIAYRGERDPDRALAILDLGASISSWGLVRNGKVIKSGIHGCGAADLCTDLAAFLRRRYGIQLAKSQAESLLASLGCRGFRNPGLSASVGCKDAFSGRIAAHIVTAGDVAEAIRDKLDDLCRRLKVFFDELPEHTLRLILDDGMDLCGGGSLIPDLAVYVSKRIGITVTAGARPLQSPAMGAARAIVSL